MSTNTSQAARGVGLDALTALANSGFVKIYTGTKPATPETALSDNTLLQTYTLANPAFGASATSGDNRVATMAGAPLTCTNAATGTATWGTVTKSDGTRLHDFDIGDLTIDTTSIVSGATGQLSSYTLTEGMTA